MFDLLGYFFDSDWFSAQLNNHFNDVIVWTVMSVLVGFGLGFAFRSWLLSLVEKTGPKRLPKPSLLARLNDWRIERKLHKQENERNLESWRAWTRDLPHDLKALLLHLSKHDGIELRSSKAYVTNQVSLVANCVNVEEIGNNLCRLSLNSQGEWLADAASDILEAVKPQEYYWWRPSEPVSIDDMTPEEFMRVMHGIDSVDLSAMEGDVGSNRP